MKTEEFISSIKNSQYSLSTDDRQSLSKLVYKIREKWEESSRVEARFLAKNKNWLEKYVELQKQHEHAKSTTKKTGRPSLYFSDSSERTKRRRTQVLREEESSDVLAYATKMKLRSEGKTDAAKIIQDITEGSPKKALQYRKSLDSINTSSVFSADEALSLYVEMGLSRNKYQQLRNACLQKKSKLIPSYKEVRKAKKKCHPAEGIFIEENEAQVKLQALLDHTVSRIVLYQIEVLKSLSTEILSNLTLIGKWGCDGSSGHSEYKQKFKNEAFSDASIFFTSFVPLQLVYVDIVTNNTIVVWKNPRPSSPRFCRPIDLRYEKESVDLTKKVVDNVQEQINKLTPFEDVVDGKRCVVSYKLCLTMIDNKVCNALTETTSAMRCYLCRSTSKDFNDIDKILKQPIIEDHLKFGLSTLHCWIRCFEFLLHLSYKLGICKWQARTEEEKKSVNGRKEHIQIGFKKSLGLNVDKPKAGSGTTNDGNTARRFFEEYQKSSAITGVDADIIHHFYNILQTISCGYAICTHSFRQYALQLAKQIVCKYPWYNMPTLIHKLLIHGPEIIDSSLLPIGQMSEDAQESCNKFIKIYRRDFSRQNFRKKTMEDVFLRFFIASDPYVSSCRKLPAKPLKSLSPEVLSLLSSPKESRNKDEEIESSSASELSTDATESDDEDDNFLF